jgi:hypothetical protein
MAVTYKNRQVRVPSADASATVLIPGRVYVKSVKWVGGTTAGHTAVIQDADSNTIWDDLCPGASYVVSELIEDWWANGFKVPTLASGTLAITYG